MRSTLRHTGDSAPAPARLRQAPAAGLGEAGLVLQRLEREVAPRHQLAGQGDGPRW